MTEFSKLNKRSFEASFGPVLSYKPIKIVLQPNKIGVEQGLDGLIQTLVGDKVNIAVLVVKVSQIGLDREADHLGVLLGLAHIRRDHILVHNVQIGDLLFFAYQFDVLFPLIVRNLKFKIDRKK